MTEAAATAPLGWRRWWIYQRERFPLAAHGPLIFAFGFCAVSYSSRLRGDGWPHPGAVAVAVTSSLLFFLQLRIADEFKDADEDRRHRPYRPVPRGLVTLRELALAFAAAAAAQLVLALAWAPRQVLALLVAWAYLTAMSVEFGCRAWLKRHPVVYLWSHMLIMPLVDFYATACDWVPARGAPPAGLGAFLVASFANGLLIELGRKLRAPADEERGVETYTVLWGAPVAVGAWLAAAALTAVAGTLAAQAAGAGLVVGALLGAGLVALATVAALFLRRQVPGAGRRIELASGVWTLLLYLSLGLVPAVAT